LSTGIATLFQIRNRLRQSARNLLWNLHFRRSAESPQPPGKWISTVLLFQKTGILAEQARRGIRAFPAVLCPARALSCYGGDELGPMGVLAMHSGAGKSSGRILRVPTRRTGWILDAARSGLSYEEIGRRFGVSGSRIRYIARQWGLPRRKPVKRIRIHCLQCGKAVTTLVTVPRKFCSKRCSYLSRRGASTDPKVLAERLAARRRICKRCQREFFVQSRPGLKQRYCGRTCGGRARSKLSDRDLHAIRKALSANRTYLEIATRLGVSRQYVHALAVGWHLTPRERSH